MSQVINLDSRRPHRTGVAVCMLTECGKWWIAVAPLDLDDALECPYCCKQHGIFADELMEIRNGGGDDGDGLPLERSA